MQTASAAFFYETLKILIKKPVFKGNVCSYLNEQCTFLMKTGLFCSAV